MSPCIYIYIYACIASLTGALQSSGPRHLRCIRPVCLMRACRNLRVRVQIKRAHTLRACTDAARTVSRTPAGHYKLAHKFACRACAVNGIPCVRRHRAPCRERHVLCHIVPPTTQCVPMPLCLFWLPMGACCFVLAARWCLFWGVLILVVVHALPCPKLHPSLSSFSRRCCNVCW